MLLSLSQLKEKFNKPLPGLPSQLKMAPQTRALELQNAAEKILYATPSAVLILLFEDNNELQTLLIKRSEYAGIHSGQMAFPGGKKEPNDASFEATALREVHEEIGVSASEIELIGSLTDLYLPPSNFLVKVFVGYCSCIPHFTLNTNEVQAVVKVAVADLFDSKNRKTKEFYAGALNQKISAPYFQLQQYEVWGATAMILSELTHVLS